jgi:hypothetical protein
MNLRNAGSPADPGDPGYARSDKTTRHRSPPLLLAGDQGEQARPLASTASPQPYPRAGRKL